MKVTDISARWARKIPRERQDGYMHGFSEVELRATAILDEGEDGPAAYDALLSDLQAAVSEKLGIAAPAEPAKAPAKKADTKADSKPAAKPKKAVASKPKADKKADKEPAKTEAADVPDDDPPQIRTNPEDRKNPADVDDIPDDDAPATPPAAASEVDDIPDDGAATSDVSGGKTHDELQTFITLAVTGIKGKKKISGGAVKEILGAFGAARTKDVPEGKIQDAWAAIEAAIEA